jgi:hypothetical protein
MGKRRLPDVHKRIVALLGSTVTGKRILEIYNKYDISGSCVSYLEI